MEKLEELNEELNNIKEELMIKEEKLFNYSISSSLNENKLEEEVKNLRKKRRQLLTKRAKLLCYKKTEPEVKSEIRDLKIKYTRKTGMYEFTYYKKEGNKWYPYRSNYTFDKTNHIRSDKMLYNIFGKGKYEKLDLDLCEALREFDMVNNTKYCRNYINDTAVLDISYDMRGKNRKLSRKDNKKLEKVAEIQSMFKNAKLKRYSRKLSYTVAGLSLIGILSLGTAIRNNTMSKNIDDIPKTDNVVMEDITLSNDEVSENNVIPIIQEDIDETEEITNQTLYSTYDETGLEAHIEKLGCASYGVSLVAVYQGEDLVKVLNVSKDDNFDIDSFIENYRRINGDNFDFSINVDGYDSNKNKIYENIGWTKNIDLVKNNSKVLVKAF